MIHGQAQSPRGSLLCRNLFLGIHSQLRRQINSAFSEPLGYLLQVQKRCAGNKHRWVLCPLAPTLTFGPQSQDTRRNTAVPLPRACQTLGWGHNFIPLVEVSADPQQVARSACLKAAPGCWWSGNGIQRGDGDGQAAPRHLMAEQDKHPGSLLPSALEAKRSRKPCLAGGAPKHTCFEAQKPTEGISTLEAQASGSSCRTRAPGC